MHAHSILVEVRGQLLRVSFLLTHGSWRLNSSQQACLRRCFSSLGHLAGCSPCAREWLYYWGVLSASYKVTLWKMQGCCLADKIKFVSLLNSGQTYLAKMVIKVILILLTSSYQEAQHTDVLHIDGVKADNSLWCCLSQFFIILVIGNIWHTLGLYTIFSS